MFKIIFTLTLFFSLTIKAAELTSATHNYEYALSFGSDGAYEALSGSTNTPFHVDYRMNHLSAPEIEVLRLTSGDSVNVVFLREHYLQPLTFGAVGGVSGGLPSTTFKIVGIDSSLLYLGANTVGVGCHSTIQPLGGLETLINVNGNCRRVAVLADVIVEDDIVVSSTFNDGKLHHLRMNSSVASALNTQGSGLHNFSYANDRICSGDDTNCAFITHNISVNLLANHTLDFTFNRSDLTMPWNTKREAFDKVIGFNGYIETNAISPVVLTYDCSVENKRGEQCRLWSEDLSSSVPLQVNISLTDEKGGLKSCTDSRVWQGCTIGHREKATALEANNIFVNIDFELHTIDNMLPKQKYSNALTFYVTPLFLTWWSCTGCKAH